MTSSHSFILQTDSVVSGYVEQVPMSWQHMQGGVSSIVLEPGAAASSGGSCAGVGGTVAVNPNLVCAAPK